MAWIYSEGMLEPEEVQEDLDEILAQLNNAANNGWHFTKFTGDMDSPIIFQVPGIIKIREQN